MRRSSAILIIALAAGCATRAWYKDGSTERDFNMDRGQCQAQAYSVSQPQAWQPALVFHGCMEGKGWTLR